MIYLRHGEHTAGNLTVPIFNFHLLTLRLAAGDVRVACSRCCAEGSPDAIAATFAAECPRRDDPA